MNENARPSWSAGDGYPSKLVKVTDQMTLNAHWPWVRDRLAAIAKRDKTVDQWQPRHIKQAVIEGIAGRNPVELWFGVTSEESPVIEGFAITTIAVDPYIQLPRAWVIWLGWMNMALMQRHIPQFRSIALEREYPAIEFITGRKGWWFSSKAEKIGFRANRMVYRMEIQ